MPWRSTGLFVKVCGLGSAADVEVSIEAGADAVGFVWYPPSPRHLELDEIRRLAEGSTLPTVLVTAGLDSATVLSAASRAGVDAVQPHGREAAVSAAAARRVGLDVIHPVSAGADVTALRGDDLLLVDSPDPEMVGGRGETFDWGVAARLDRPFLLAGGLGPDNVAEAVRRVRPFGVDASSGLESAPGVKSAGLIRRFVQEARQA
jgi:phosphoribosylanthranilate isomerase